MSEFLKMDVFFVTTTAAVVVVTILLVLLIMRLLRILKRVEDISLMVEEEGEKLRQDIAEVRAKAKEEGLRVTHILRFLGLAGRKKRSKKSDS